MAVLQLAHPGTSDPIVSADHKRWITARFVDAAGTSPDVDRRLLAVRTALTPQYGEDFDWYDDWLVRLWWKNGKDWKSFLRWLEHSRAGAGRPAPETGQLLENGDDAADRGVAQRGGGGDEMLTTGYVPAGLNPQVIIMG